MKNVSAPKMPEVKMPKMPEIKAQAKAQAKAEAKKLAIKMRAEALLKSALDKEQLAEYELDKTVTVKISEVKSLRIRAGRTHNIDELDKDGKKVASLCVHVRDNVPNEDNMLAQLLFARTDIEGFYAMANRSNW